MEDNKEDKNNPEDENQIKNDPGTGLYDLGMAIGGGGQEVIGSDNPGDDEEYNKARLQERVILSGGEYEKADD